MVMRYLSLFSGVGGLDLGLDRAGMTCVAQCEIDEYRREVLERHWPGVERYEDVRELRGDGQGLVDGDEPKPPQPRGRNSVSPVDLICGGFPCQDLSVAGRRAGLSGSRSGLWWEFERIVGEIRPTWVLLENVPGLLSSNGGDDFALILDAMGKRGYGYAYRILDSRYYGVAQRRRRVFALFHASGRCDYPASVLFEPASGGGDTAARGAEREDVAYSLTASVRGSGPKGADHETYVPETAYSLTKRDHKGVSQRESTTTLVADAIAVRTAQTSTNGHGVSEGVSHTLDGAQGQAVAFDDRNQTVNDKYRTLSGEMRSDGIQADSAVRRLTPTECERLQGFPDGWTHGKDGPRYAALGDAVTVNVAEWIGRRIMLVEEASR